MKNDDLDRELIMTDGLSLWSTSDRSHWFLIKDSLIPPSGSTPIRSLSGESALVDLDWLAPFEVTDEKARRVVKGQLGQTLEELKHGIDEKLDEWRQTLDEFNRRPVSKGSTVTPNAASALFDLLKQLPRVIGQSLSGDDNRVEAAREAMTDLQRRLKESGVDLDKRLSSFPDRLAELRKEARQGAANTSKTNEDPPKKF